MKMAFELQMVGLAALLGLINILWLIPLTVSKFGMKWAFSPRDQPVPFDGMIGRVQRALTNFGETFPLFAAAVFAAYLGGRLGALTCCGALAYVVGRAVYLPVYAFGVPVLRTVAWLAAFGGICAILLALVI